MKLPYPKTVKDAAIALDTAKPGWFLLVSRPILMGSGDSCVLGQITNNEWWTGLNKFFDNGGLLNYDVIQRDTIFGVNASNSEWQKEVDARNAKYEQTVKGVTFDGSDECLTKIAGIMVSDMKDAAKIHVVKEILAAAGKLNKIVTFTLPQA